MHDETRSSGRLQALPADKLRQAEIANPFRNFSVLNPKLLQMMIQMVVHKLRPFHGSHPAKKALRMPGASLWTTGLESIEQCAQPLPFCLEIPIVTNN